MIDKFRWTCYVAPGLHAGPLISTLDQSARVFSSRITPPRGSPKGINIESVMILDLQQDGGLDGIEILYPIPNKFVSSVDTHLATGAYARLFLTGHPGGNIAVTDGLEVAIRNETMNFTFSTSSPAYEVPLGPSVSALLGDSELRGIALNLANFKH